MPEATEPSNGNAAPAAAAPSTEAAPPKLSGAELKKRAKAEKAARRAKEKEAGGATGIPIVTPAAVEAIAHQASAEGAPSARRKSQTHEAKSRPQQQQQQQQQQQSRSQIPPNRRGSTSHAQDKQLPTRRRPSQSIAADKQESKQLPFFAHLYGQPRRQTIDGVSKDVHPAVLALGLQLSSYTVCGSSARCVATLLALKAVISSYTTPPGHALSRHLTTHHLSPQLAHLKASRPFAVTQSNAIRWLKDQIIKIDPAVPEEVAKANLAGAIDTYIRERITVADSVIADAAAAHISTDDVVLVFAKSHAVQLALLAAAQRGTRFRVLVVDSRPLFEGRHLAAALTSACPAATSDVQIEYFALTSLAHAATQATKCLLGAHAVLSNGAVQSRAGTALTALMAQRAGCPVIVCAETIKFTDRAALDSIVSNELAPEEEIVPWSGGASAGATTTTTWRDAENLGVVNALYDVTPHDLINVIVTELGQLPPTSAPVVQRMGALA